MYSSKVMSSIGLGLVATCAVAGLVMLDLHVDFLDPFGGQASVCMIKDVRDPKADKIRASLSPVDQLASVERRCTSMGKEFEALQKDMNNKDQQQQPQLQRQLSKAAAAFQNLMDFEHQYVNTMQALEQAHIELAPQSASEQPDATASSEESPAVMTMRSKRSTARVCFLQLATAARRMAASLPRELDNSNGALGCEWGMLNSLGARAIRDVEAEPESARSLAYLGAHWSEIAINSHSAAPLFGTGPTPSGKTSGTRFPVLTTYSWERDSWGTFAPGDLVYAEAVLSRSAELRRAKNPVLIMLHARRLEEHAKFLADQDQYDASAQRFRAMAKLAEDEGLSALSASALSQLAHTLKMHGSHEEAISAASEAVALTLDPLAQFVLASARLSSGLLTTDASMKAAEVQLRAGAGQMPTEELEVQRAKMHLEMRMWSWISTKDISKCRMVGDAAKFLICTIAKLMF